MRKLFSRKNFLLKFENRLNSIKYKNYSNNTISINIDSIQENKTDYFLPFCQMINLIESNNSYLKKQEIFSDFLLENIKNLSDSNKQLNFNQSANIIRLTVPSLLHLDETEGIKQDRSEIIRNQYNYKFILQKFAKENLYLGPIESTSNLDIQLKKLTFEYGGIHKLISEKFYFTNDISELTLNEVIYNKLDINYSTGVNSSEIKMNKFKQMLNKCSNKLEVYYISRLFTNQMNCGISSKSVIKCINIAKNKFLSNKDDSKYEENFKLINEFIEFLEEKVFRHTIQMQIKSKTETETEIDNDNDNDNNDNNVIKGKHKKNSDKNPSENSSGNIKENFNISPEKFFEVCLCKPGVNIDGLIKEIEKKKFTKIIADIKYDGERSQLHFDGKILKMGSRKFEDQSVLYANFHENLISSINFFNQNKKEKIENFILDGEIICYTTKLTEREKRKNLKLKILDFQELRKKYSEDFDSEKIKKYIKYSFVAFDILLYNGNQLHYLNLEERKKLLIENFFGKIPEIVIETGKEINYIEPELFKSEIFEYYKVAKRINCEGLIIKFLGKNTNYEFGKRKWLKLKSLEQNSNETLDLIPIGAFRGKGINNSKKFTSFLMAAFDPINDTYHPICKVGTGFNTEELDELVKILNNNILYNPKENYIIPLPIKPDCYFDISEVWEIGFDKFSESGVYLTNLNPMKFSGVSLRFPRFIRKRKDKSIEQSSNIYYLQELIEQNFER